MERPVIPAVQSAEAGESESSIKLKARDEGDSSVVMCLARKYKDLRVWVSSTQVKGRRDCKDLSSQNWGVRDRTTPGAD